MFPLLYLLYFYAAFALFALLFLFFNVYHMAHFGLQTGKTYFFILLYLGSFMTALIISLLFLVQIDWSQNVELSTLVLHFFAIN